MRRCLVVLGLVAGALTLSCSGDGSNFAPSDAQRINATTTATCPALTQAQYNALIAQLGKLYPTTSKTYTALVGKVTEIKAALSKGKVADAQQKTFDILKVVYADWTAGKLKAGATTADINELVRQLYVATCLGTPPTVTDGGGAGIITPAGGGTVLTSDKQAGVRFPAGAVDVNTIVTIAPTTDTLNTMLDKYPPTYDFTATPHDPGTPFNLDITVGICLNPSIDATVYNRLKLGHNILDGYTTPNRFGKIEILPLADVTTLGLSCPTLGSVGSASAVDRWKSYAAALFLPEPLHAASAGLATTKLGGTTRTLSPVAAVDPQVQLSKNGGDGQTATAGTAVATPPSVLAKTANGTNVPGVPILFAVTAGGGTISPADDGNPNTIDYVLTNASGVAAATSWTLGATPGTNTATGTGQSLNNVSAQLSYTGSPVSFTATATPQTLDYGAQDWMYILIGSTPPGGGTPDYPGNSWYTPGFVATAWSTGSAPFGSIGVTAGCGILTGATAPVTNWPTATGSQAVASTGSGLLLRNTFTAAPGSSLLVSVAIDNDIQVFVDGNDITNDGAVTFDANTNTEAPVNGYWDGVINQFRAHGGCAQRGDGVFHVPSTKLANQSTHTIAVYAHDWGSAAYVDVKVTVDAPVQIN